MATMSRWATPEYDAVRTKHDAHFMPPAVGNGGAFGLSPIKGVHMCCETGRGRGLSLVVTAVNGDV